MKHLLGPDNTFLSLNDFCRKYEIDPHPRSFYGLISAVKSLRSDSNFQDLHDANYEILRNFTSHKRIYINA